MRSGVFSKFDYGKEKNLEVYGTELPPRYDTAFMASNIRKYPTLLIRGENDYLVDSTDFKELKDILSQVSSNEVLKVIEVPEYGHLDYLWARNVQQKVIQPVLQFMLKNY
jgi:lysosomal acid lipase/cholesteryl ester hydrolase